MAPCELQRRSFHLFFRKDGIAFKKRLQAFIHLTGYIIHPLMTISFILTCISTFFNINNTVATEAGYLFGTFGVFRSASARGFIFIPKSDLDGPRSGDCSLHDCAVGLLNFHSSGREASFRP